MKPDGVKLGITFVVVFLILSVVTLLNWDFVRDGIITPIYYALWVGDLALKSIPQQVFVVLLVFISFMIGFDTLLKARNKSALSILYTSGFQAESRYQRWSKLCANLNAGVFSRNQFITEARRLVLSILAYEQRVDVKEAEARVKNNMLEIPDGIKKLILQKEFDDSLIEPPTSPPSPLSASREGEQDRRDLASKKGFTNSAVILRLQRRLGLTEAPRNPQTERLIADVIDFLEDHLEIQHDGNQPQVRR